MFFNCLNIIEINLSNFKTDKVQNMEGIFDNCSNNLRLQAEKLSQFKRRRKKEKGKEKTGSPCICQ